jgi:hypothetical protein
MSIPAAWPQVLDFFGTPLVIEPSSGQLSSDTGLPPLRQFDEQIGLTQASSYRKSWKWPSTSLHAVARALRRTTGREREALLPSGTDRGLGGAPALSGGASGPAPFPPGGGKSRPQAAQVAQEGRVKTASDLPPYLASRSPRKPAHGRAA